MFWPLAAHIKDHYVQEVTKIQCDVKQSNYALTLNLPTTTIVAQPFNVIKWQLKFNPVP